MTIADIPELRRICQAPVRAGALRHDPFYRFVSIYLTRLFIPLGWSPNAVTTLSLGLGLLAGLAFMDLTPLRLVVGVFLVQGYLILDYVDGELSRYQKTSSLGGRFYEVAGCTFIDPFLLLGLAWGAWRQTGWAGFMVLGVIGALTQVFFRLIPSIMSATLLGVHLGAADRSTGETTPEPTDPPMATPGSFHRLYAMGRFPFFHPNFLLLITHAGLGDLGLGIAGRSIWATALLVAFYGVLTPIFTVWQCKYVISGGILETRYHRAFHEGRSFREHV